MTYRIHVQPIRYAEASEIARVANKLLKDREELLKYLAAMPELTPDDLLELKAAADELNADPKFREELRQELEEERRLRVSASDFHAAMELGTQSKETCAEVTKECLKKIGMP